MAVIKLLPPINGKTSPHPLFNDDEGYPTLGFVNRYGENFCLNVDKPNSI